MCRSPPPPPPPLSDLFEFDPPPPKQTPWRRPMAMIIPLPHYDFLVDIFLKSEKMCRSPPPPPPPLSDLFQFDPPPP